MPKSSRQFNGSLDSAPDLDKMQPQNLEAEQSIIGSLLIDQDAIVKVADIIRPDDFYKPAHSKIYHACLELFERNEPIDILSLSTLLSDKDQLKNIGGRSYIAHLASITPTTSHVKNYAQIVHKKATLRRLISASQRIAEYGYDEEAELDALLDQAEQQLFSVSQQYLKQNFIPIQDLLADTFERIDDLHKGGGKIRGVPTGYTDLDNMLSGLQPSDLIILAARPSMGKTTFALDIARNVAIRSKTPVGIFSLEMSKEQLADRLLCADAGVGLWKMHTGKLSDKDDGFGESDFAKLGHAFGRLSEAKIHIDDTAMITVMEIRAKARRLYSEHGLGLIIIDYLQLINSDGREENRVQEVSKMTRALKAIARELNIPVLTLSQLSRAVESRSPAIPSLADLRDSGSIEQDADVVTFIYRKSRDRSVKSISDDDRNAAQVYIAKHRNGPVGMINLYFNEDIISFQNLTTKHSSQESPQPFEAQEEVVPEFQA